VTHFALFGLVCLGLGACGATPGHAMAPPRRLGDAMTETGVRFARIGRAAAASRWQLAAYDLDELQEIFREDLAGSSWEGNPRLPPLAKTLQARDLPAIGAALRAGDTAKVAQAIEQAARTCNACHQAADKAFLEVSPVPGADVPVMTPRATPSP
jgi:hypothetical protein